MPPRDPMRVLVVRTSRFLPAALAAVGRRWPTAAIRVIYQPGTERELLGCGVVPEHDLKIPGPFVLPRLYRSRVWQTLLDWRPEAVVVQWWNEHGEGHEAADRAALAFRAARFHAVLEDGRWIDHTWLGRATRAARRRLLSAGLVAAVALATVLLAPWSAWQRVRGQRRRLAATNR